MATSVHKADIRRVLEVTDIVSVIGARVPLKKAGGSYKACCPFHDEKTPSFLVSPSRQTYHCFGCGAHGDALDFLREHDHFTFRGALDDLAGRAGIDLDTDPDIGRRQMQERKYRKDIYREDTLLHECWVLYLGEFADIWLTQDDEERLELAKGRVRNGIGYIYPLDGPVTDDQDMAGALETLIEELGNRRSARALRGQKIPHLVVEPIPEEVTSEELAAARALHGMIGAAETSSNG